MLFVEILLEAGEELAYFRGVTKFETWRADEGVLLSSAKRFKGLEADAVVIICVPSDAPDDLMEQYVARSRAKHILVVVEVEVSGD